MAATSGLSPSALQPLLDWDLTSPAVAAVVASVASLAPHLLPGQEQEQAWVTPYCLLACDYLRATTPGVDASLTDQVTTIPLHL